MKVLFGFFLAISLSFNLVDKDQFYDVFLSESKERIQKLINEYDKNTENDSQINVYKGALFIKLASFINVPAKKLENFKRGKALLENEISNKPSNIEFRFIRLILQEQTPPILKYKSNIQEDKRLIKSHFKLVDAKLKKRIVDYSKISSILIYSELME